MSERTGHYTSTGDGERGRIGWDAVRVRRLREHLGVTQAGLAELLGTRQQTISEWERGGSSPRRMSQRLLRMVAEEHGFYSTDDRRGHAPTEPPAADVAAGPGPTASAVAAGGQSESAPRGEPGPADTAS